MHKKLMVFNGSYPNIDVKQVTVKFSEFSLEVFARSGHLECARVVHTTKATGKAFLSHAITLGQNHAQVKR